MDLKKVSGLTPAINEPVSQPSGSTKVDLKGGVGFDETLRKLQSQGLVKPEISKSALTDGVKFSNHAVERMKTRGISYSPEDLGKLNDAIQKADAKGAKDSLVLLGNSALIVSVKNKTVVTVMDQTQLKENVFTNIDSTIVM